jgi:hypothetical protein
MAIEFNKGPDGSPALWAAGAVGFFASMVLARYLGLTKDWGTLLVVVGVCIPVLIVNWRAAKKRGGSNLS